MNKAIWQALVLIAIAVIILIVCAWVFPDQFKNLVSEDSIRHFITGA